jgi:hypothetical protein
LTVVGPYPVSMVDIPGERLHNMSPPTLALLALATAQLGLVLLLRDRAERWLHRPGPWRVVVGVNGVILTVFLWHISAALLLSGALDALGLLPTPTVGTTAWWLWRLPWLIMLLPALGILVALFGPVEARRSRRSTSRPRRLPAPVAAGLTRPAPRLLLTVGGYAATVFGLLDNNLAARTGHYPFGLPTAALLAFLAGAGTLRLLGSVPDRGRAPPPGGANVSSGSGTPG